MIKALRSVPASALLIVVAVIVPCKSLAGFSAGRTRQSLGGCGAVDPGGAYDKTYQTTMVEDACASGRTDLQEAVVRIWNCFGFVRTTDQVVGEYPWQSWISPTLIETKESAARSQSHHP